MNKFLSILIAAPLLLVAARAARVLRGPVPEVSTGLSQPLSQNDKRREKLQRVKLEEIHGEAAALRVRQLRRLSKGIARAMQDAEKKGLRRAFEHSRVILGIEPSDKPGTARVTPSVPRLMQIASYNSSHPQETFTDGEYEVTFIPYDDGNPNNWEGIIYRYDPDWGDDIRAAVVDIQTETPAVIEEIYYPPDGTDPQPLDPRLEQTISSNGIRTCKPSTSAPSVRTKGEVSSALSPTPACPSGWKHCLRLPEECCSPPPGLNAWFQCSAKGCMAVAGACSRTGPIWGDCWGFGCSSAMLLCIL